MSKLSFEEQENESKYEEMILSILNTIAKDKSTEKIRREVDLLTNIQTCKRNFNETPSSFAVRFNIAVATYTNHTSALT